MGHKFHKYAVQKFEKKTEDKWTCPNCEQKYNNNENCEDCTTNYVYGSDKSDKRLASIVKERHLFLVYDIYDLYRDGLFWWEILEIFRSAVMTGCLILLRSGSLLQHVFGTLLLLCHLMLVSVVRPYKKKWDNDIQFLLSAVLLITLPASSAIHRSKAKDEREGLLDYLIYLNLLSFAFCFMLRAREDVTLKPHRNKKKETGNSEHPHPIVQKIINHTTSNTKVVPDNRKKGLDRERTATWVRLSGLKAKYMDLFNKDYEEMKNMDLNGDGTLEEAELVEYYVTKQNCTEEEAKKKALEMIKKYDENGDHKLDIDEIRSTIRERLLKMEIIDDENWIKTHEENEKKRKKRQLKERLSQRKANHNLKQIVEQMKNYLRKDTTNKTSKEIKDIEKLLKHLRNLDEKDKYNDVRVRSEKMLNIQKERKEKMKLLMLNGQRQSILLAILRGQQPLGIIVEIMAAALFVLGTDVPIHLAEEEEKTKELATAIAPFITEIRTEKNKFGLKRRIENFDFANLNKARVSEARRIIKKYEDTTWGDQNRDVEPVYEWLKWVVGICDHWASSEGKEDSRRAGELVEEESDFEEEKYDSEDERNAGNFNY